MIARLKCLLFGHRPSRVGWFDQKVTAYMDDDTITTTAGAWHVVRECSRCGVLYVEIKIEGIPWEEEVYAVDVELSNHENGVD